MKQRLKPCPFCGGKATTFNIPENTPEEMATHPDWRWNHPGKWVVGCTEDWECMGNFNHMTRIFLTEESAIEAWNRRANSTRKAQDEDLISRQFIKSLGAMCIAVREEDGELYALGSIDAIPPAQSDREVNE